MITCYYCEPCVQKCVLKTAGEVGKNRVWMGELLTIPTDEQ